MSVERAEFIPPESEPEVPTMLLWRVLVEPYRRPRTTEGGIELAQEALDTALLLTGMGKVISLGPLAYQDKTKTGLSMAGDPNEPVPGDWIMFRPNAGMRVKLRDDREYIILNDDELLGKVDNPSLYQQWV